MSLIIAYIIESITNKCSFSITRSEELYDSVRKLIKHTLTSSADILVFGFGKSCMKEKNER